MNEYFSDLNERELELSKYILENYESIPNMSVNELANNNYTSKSSVIRFCQKIGFSGYTELKNYIKWDHNTNDKISGRNHILDYVKDDIQKTIEYISESDWTEIYDRLIETSQIYIIPTGYTQQSQAKELSRLFLLFNKRVEIINNVSPSNEFKRILEIAEENSIFFLISQSGENENLIELQKQLILKSFTTISLTTLKSNIIASNSTFNLYATTTKSPVRSDWWVQTSSAFFVVIEAFMYGFLDYLRDLEKTE
ncbi:MurR/RpiR family transcriptional regulator [Carnobacteriaceae bacterium 52-44]